MKNRIALITGGLGDIGTAICQEFFRQGAHVIAVSQDDDQQALLWQSQQKILGYDIELTYTDVTLFERCSNMADTILKQHGAIDILVNAAGVIHDAAFRNMTPQEWNQVVHTDLDSMFNVTRPFINTMIERRYGRIINISSVSGEKGQFGQTNYAAAKSGIYGFTKSLAQEVAKYGITVNSVSPGFVESNMVMSIPEAVRQKIINETPVGRLAKPSEIAWSIAFLASERSAFITGTDLAVNGGLH